MQTIICNLLGSIQTVIIDPTAGILHYVVLSTHRCMCNVGFQLGV